MSEFLDGPSISTGGPCICCRQPEGSQCWCHETKREIARLRKENERLSRLVVHDSEGRVVTQGAFNQLICQNERLRKDAERYKYIRCGRRTTAIYEYIRGERLLKLEHELDAAIDAAKEAE